MYIVEFVGGPVDGRVMSIPELIVEYRVPERLLPNIMSNEDLIPSAESTYKYIKYELVLDKQFRPVLNSNRNYQYKYVNPFRFQNVS